MLPTFLKSFEPEIKQLKSEIAAWAGTFPLPV